jgi:ABC-type transport system involved in multi-copper enzyme maturation permease subunit
VFAQLHNQPVNVGIIFKLAVISFVFMWVIYSAGMLVSAVVNERAKVYMIVGGLVFLMYAANVVATLQASLRWLHRISVFNYYNAQDLLTKGVLRTTDMIVLAVLALVFTLVALTLFSKRDISV